MAKIPRSHVLHHIQRLVPNKFFGFLNTIVSSESICFSLFGIDITSECRVRGVMCGDVDGVISLMASTLQQGSLSPSVTVHYARVAAHLLLFFKYVHLHLLHCQCSASNAVVDWPLLPGKSRVANGGPILSRATQASSCMLILMSSSSRLILG